ncbi:hypothetical protein ABW09_17100 [Pluralibacter gergoviae]|nr:hypothetical protein ABW09_17100 [Pluralibacter gergoviae]
MGDYMELDVGYSFKAEDGSITHNGCELLSITGIRQEILKLLLTNKNKFVSRVEIIEVVWGSTDTSLYNSSLTQQIYLLRKDLAKIDINIKIISHHHQGYKLCDAYSDALKRETYLHSNGNNCRFKKTVIAKLRDFPIIARNIFQIIIFIITILNSFIVTYLLIMR